MSLSTPLFTTDLSLSPLVIMIVTSAARADVVGMVMEASGPVSVNGRPVEVTDSLHGNNRLVLGKGAVISLVHFSAHSLYSSTGPAVLLMNAKGVDALEGSAPKVKKLPEEKTQLARDYQGRVVPATLVMKGLIANGPRLVYPLKGETVLSSALVLSWEGGKPVKLSLLEGERLLLEKPSVTGIYALPNNLGLAKGHQYRWRLEELGERGRLVEGDFTLASDAQLQQIAHFKPTSNAPASDWAFYALALERAGALTEMRRIWDRMKGVQE